VITATLVFAAAHSALASRLAKERAAHHFGERHRAGLYRLFYVLQTILLLSLFYAYVRRLPDRPLYRLRGPIVSLIYAGQAANLLFGLLAVRQIGWLRGLGLASAGAWLRGEMPSPEPEAQGPRLGADGTMLNIGPFAWCRHPINFVGVPFFWLTTSMSVNRLAFNMVITLYLVLGSMHEEARLRAVYGPAYIAYQNSGVPFFVPRPPWRVQ